MTRIVWIGKQGFRLDELPIPPRYFNPWAKLVRLMEPGEVCFLKSRVEQSACLRAARKAKIKVVTRKVNGKGFGLWRM